MESWKSDMNGDLILRCNFSEKEDASFLHGVLP